MKINLNHNVVEIEANSKIEAVFKMLSIENIAGVAVAVNGNLLPRKEWDKYIIGDNDKILVVKATQGG